MKDIIKNCRFNLVKWKEKKYIFALVILISGIIMFSSTICNIVFASSKTTQNQKKRFVSVKVEEGDSLWSIAKDYYSTSGQDKVDAYIKEIKLCNGLKGNTIHTGRYLIIPYYENVIEN